MEKQLVVFRLENEEFGIDIASVREINKYQKVNRLPQAPAYVEGMLNLRGKVSPILDLRRRLGWRKAEVDRETRILVAMLMEQQYGLIVDSVSEVLTVSEEMIEEAPDIVKDIDVRFISGVVSLDGRLIIVLDLPTVLAPIQKVEATA